MVIKSMNENLFQPLIVVGADEIREILAKRIDQQKQALGIVVGIIDQNGRRIVTYGKPAKGNPRSLDGDTIFEIGSISKVFTSLALADMVNRDEVALDDPAADYLPEGVHMPERSGRAITLLDLSTHTSGLPPLPGNFRMDGVEYGMDDLYRFLSGYILPRDPGSEYEYSNLGAGLLGHILARRAGTDYEDLIRMRITQPLSMPDTGIKLASSMDLRMATGHTATLEPVANSEFPAPLAGAGALRSSANDMLTFLEAFLGYRESPLTAAMKSMLEARRPIGKVKIGLGWFICSTDGREVITHSGATRSFASFAGIDAQERIGVVVLSNASTRFCDGPAATRLPLLDCPDRAPSGLPVRRCV